MTIGKKKNREQGLIRVILTFGFNFFGILSSCSTTMDQPDMVLLPI